MSDDEDDEKMNGAADDGPSLPFVTGSETSEAAAGSMRARAPHDEERVYSFIASQGKHGATDDEIERALKMRHQSASARRNGLVLKGRVVDSGLEPRKTRSGRGATVWVAGEGNVTKTPRICRPSNKRIREAVKDIRDLACLAAENPDVGNWTEKDLISEDLVTLLAWLDRTAAK